MPPSRHARLGLLAIAVLLPLSGCSSDSTHAASAPPSATSAPTTEVPTLAPTASSPTPSSPTPSSTASLPKEVLGQQGSTYFGVYLAVTKTAKDPALAKARARAQSLGYEGGEGEIGCTRGARAELKLPATGDYFAFSIFFATQQQAQQAASAFGSDVVGVAKVTAYCVD